MSLHKKLNHYTFSFTQARKIDFDPMTFSFSKEEMIALTKKENSDSTFEIGQVNLFVPESGVISVSKNKKHLVSGRISAKVGMEFDDVEKTIREIFTRPPFRNILSVEDADSKEFGLECWVLNTNDSNIKVDVYESYWLEILSRKREDGFVVPRLISAMKGFYMEDCFTHNQLPNRGDLLKFADSKRPYGNKDVAASIAFNLGWDWAGILHRTSVPEMIEEEAMRLHELVKKELYSEIIND